MKRPSLWLGGGRELLARIKSDNGLKTIPMLILSISQSDADIAKASQL